MSLKQLLCAVLFVMVVAPFVSHAMTIRTYVSEFDVMGVPNKDELKVTLQRVLSSRLDQSQVQIVESAEKSELFLSGSYAQIGKVFSLDLLIKNSKTGFITEVYEQGDGQDDLIPAVGRLAKKALQAIEKLPGIESVSLPDNRVVNRDKVSRDIPENWTSAPLNGIYSSIALGRTLPSGEREVFAAGEHSILFFHMGSELKQSAEIVIPLPARILAIDTADLDHDNATELYVTIMDREALSSRIYLRKDSGLVMIAEKLPWFFRGRGNELKSRAMLVQKITTGGDYVNGVDELVKTGDHFETGNTRKLPRSGNIFNSTYFRDSSGVEKGVVLNKNGYLVMFAADGSEIWKSSDKFGGSVSYFQYGINTPSSTGEQFVRHFLEQRLTVFPNGMLLVPHNDGAFNIGYNRSYNKHQFHVLKWTGTMFKEVWQTQPVPSCLADYAYDPALHEVVLLEIVQKPGLFGEGKTAISINKVE